jgi:hypothetical protein
MRHRGDLRRCWQLRARKHDEHPCRELERLGLEAAIGTFVNNLVGGAHQTLAESWIGNTWTMLNTPNPAGSGNSYLSGITCGSSTACTAVGWSNNGSTDLTLVEQYK